MNLKENFEKYYETFEEIGSGHFAVVYRCREYGTENNGKEYAAKFIRKKRASASRRGLSMDEIRREVEILYELSDHPNVVSLKDVYDSVNNVILVLELVRGGELYDVLLEKKFLEDREAAFYVRQLLLGLGHLHSKNIVHLDLKPENIMIQDLNTNHIKIIDFGLARKLKGTDISREMKGTPEFVAPEIINFDPISLATDMWSLGVTAYILLSGASPFLGSSRQQTYENIVKVDYIFDEEYFGRVSHSAKDFISKLLIGDPRKRLNVKQCLEHTWIMGYSALHENPDSLCSPTNSHNPALIQAGFPENASQIPEYHQNGYLPALSSHHLYPTPPLDTFDILIAQGPNNDKFIVSDAANAASNGLKDLHLNDDNNHDSKPQNGHCDKHDLKNEQVKIPCSSNDQQAQFSTNGFIKKNGNNCSESPSSISSSSSSSSNSDKHPSPQSNKDKSFRESNSSSSCQSNSTSSSIPSNISSEKSCLYIEPRSSISKVPGNILYSRPHNTYLENSNSNNNNNVHTTTKELINNHTQIYYDDIIRRTPSYSTLWKKSVKLLITCLKVIKNATAQTLIRELGIVSKDILLKFMDIHAQETLLSSFILACQTGDLLSIQEILALTDTNFCDIPNSKGVSGILMAIINGHANVVKYLHSNGYVRFDRPDNLADQKEYIISAINYGTLPIIKYLIDNGVNINTKNSDEESILHLAILMGHKHVIEYLVSHPAINPNMKDKFGNTPLHLATVNELNDVVSILCNNSNHIVDLDQINSNHETALHLAMNTPNNVECLQTLLAAGANPNVLPTNNLSTNNSSQCNPAHGPAGSPLHYAISKRNVSAALLLIDSGADLESCDRIGDFPIHLACKENLLAIVQTLCAFGCDVNIPNMRGFYPIHLAARNGNLEICRCLCLACCNVSVPTEYLISNGAPSNGHADIDEGSKFPNSLTAHEIALSFGHQKVADFLAHLVGNEQTKISGLELASDQNLLPYLSALSSSLLKPFNSILNSRRRRASPRKCRDKIEKFRNLTFPYSPCKQVELVSQLLPLSLGANETCLTRVLLNGSSNKLLPIDPERLSYQTYRLKVKLFGESASGKTSLIETLKNPPSFLTRLSPNRSLFTFQSRANRNAMYHSDHSKLLDRIRSSNKFDFSSPYSTSSIFNPKSNLQSNNLSRFRSSSQRHTNRLSLIETPSKASESGLQKSVANNRLRGASFSAINNNNICISQDGLQGNPHPSNNSKTYDSTNYKSSQGINVSTVCLPSVGDIKTWDFPGSPKYRQIFDHFLGDYSSIHFVVFDASQPLPTIVNEICCWINYLSTKFRCDPRDLLQTINPDTSSVSLNLSTPNAIEMGDEDILSHDLDKINFPTSFSNRLINHMGRSCKLIRVVLIGTHLDKLLSPATIPSLEILRKQILVRLYRIIPQTLTFHFDVFHKIFFLDCSISCRDRNESSKSDASFKEYSSPSLLNKKLLINFEGNNIKTLSNENGVETPLSAQFNDNYGNNNCITTNNQLIIDNFINTEWLEFTEYLEYQKYLYIQNLPPVTGFLLQTIRAIESWRQIYANCPVMTWPLFVEHVHEHVNCLASLDHMKELVTQLQYMGEVLFVKCENKPDFIVIQPDWLCKEVFSRLLSEGMEMVSRQINQTLGNTSSQGILGLSSQELSAMQITKFDLDELSELFDGFDIVELLPLLEALGICVQFQDIIALLTPVGGITNYKNTTPQRRQKKSTLEYEFPSLNILQESFYKSTATLELNKHLIPRIGSHDCEDGIFGGYRLLPTLGNDTSQAILSNYPSHSLQTIMCDIFPRIQVKLRALCQENFIPNSGLYQYFYSSYLRNDLNLEGILNIVAVIPCDSDKSSNNINNTAHLFSRYAIDIIAWSTDSLKLFHFLNDILNVVVAVIRDTCPGLLIQQNVLQPNSLKLHFNQFHQLNDHGNSTNSSNQFIPCYDANSQIISFNAMELFFQNSLANASSDASFLSVVCFDNYDIFSSITPWWDLPIEYLFANQSPTNDWLLELETLVGIVDIENNCQLPQVLRQLSYALDQYEEHGKDWCLFAISLGLADLLPQIDANSTQFNSLSKIDDTQNLEVNLFEDKYQAAPTYSRTHLILRELFKCNNASSRCVNDLSLSNCLDLLESTGQEFISSPDAVINYAPTGKGCIRTMGQLVNILQNPCDRQDIALSITKILPLFVEKVSEVDGEIDAYTNGIT